MANSPANAHSLNDLLEFLTHASERGLMPVATAQALAVACRNVFGVLDATERAALPLGDLDGIIKRFTNKRAKEFSPSSLKEYGRRVHRAVELYQRWRESPADFSIKTRATNGSGKKERPTKPDPLPAASTQATDDALSAPMRDNSGYQTAFPIRPGQVVTVVNIPYDLSTAEAKRFARFVEMLALVEP